MRRIFLLAIVMLGFCVVSKAQDSVKFSGYSYYDDKRYEFKITEEMLDRSPAWAEGEEYPPLSPGRAFQIASGRISKLIPNAEKWRKDRIALFPVGDKWIYEIKFLEPNHDGLYEGLHTWFSMIVLMNGEAVEPKITKQKQH